MSSPDFPAVAVGQPIPSLGAFLRRLADEVDKSADLAAGKILHDATRNGHDPKAPVLQSILLEINLPATARALR